MIKYLLFIFLLLNSNLLIAEARWSDPAQESTLISNPTNYQQCMDDCVPRCVYQDRNLSDSELIPRRDPRREQCQNDCHDYCDFHY